jgi:phosphoserine phosphatase
LRRPGRVGTVVFDCDNTLAAVEGIEALARAHREEVERLTEAAMGGAVPLEAVYGRRLALVRPSRARVEQLAGEYIDALVPDAREVVAALRTEGIAVYVLSGGLLPAVLGVARELGLEADVVDAVDVRFDEHGAYAGFDASSPLARSGGKAEMLASRGASLPRPLMLVGDGVTDLEARHVVDLFVGFAGAVAREAVLGGADLAVRAFSLAPILPIALAGEPPRDPAARALFERGLAMLEPGVRASLSYVSTAER